MTTPRTILAAAFLSCLASAHALAGSYTADELGRKAVELGVGGMTATFRSQQITVTGIFDRFVDTGYGDVWITFAKPSDGYSVTCSFDRGDLAAYDRFALMAPGNTVTMTGKYEDTDGAFYQVNLVDCAE